MRWGTLAVVTFVAGVTAWPEIIDRIAVSVDRTVITESEVIRQIRITALLNGEQPDLSAANRRETAERLVEQALMRREIAVSRYSPNAGAQGEQMYQAFRKRFPADAAWNETLLKYAVSDSDIRAAFLWQATFLQFVDLRFRPAIQVPEQEIQSWYDEHLKGKSTPEATESYEEARPKIEEILMQQRVDNAIDRWLGQARTQASIRYRQEAFR